MSLSHSIITAAALLGISSSTASPVEPRDAFASAYCSSSDGTYTLTSFDAPVSGVGNANDLSTWKLSVDDTSSGYKQKITGFGAAVTDATVAVFNGLPDDTLNELLEKLMTSSGADFSFMRHTIASSDLSADPAYSYDDNGGSADPSMTGFNIGDRGTAMAGLLAKMRSLKSSLVIFGSSWSAPGWMKLNKELYGTTVNNNLNPDYRSSLADYFVSYLKAYADAGASIDALAIQNEPLNSASDYPTLYVYADEAGDIISQNLAPALQAAGLKTQVWAYDHNTDHPEYPQTVLDSATSHVSAVAWHCYANPNDWGVLSNFHTTNPNTLQYMTECWTSPQTSWNQAADFTMGPLQNWASGSLAWTLGSDTSYGPHLSSGGCSTCRGLVVVDASAGTYSFAIDYYMMAQFSKFMPPGATVLNGSGSYSYSDGTGIESVASLNPDGSKTVIMTNKFANDVPKHGMSPPQYPPMGQRMREPPWRPPPRPVPIDLTLSSDPLLEPVVDEPVQHTQTIPSVVPRRAAPSIKRNLNKGIVVDGQSSSDTTTRRSSGPASVARGCQELGRSTQSPITHCSSSPTSSASGTPFATPSQFPTGVRTLDPSSSVSVVAASSSPAPIPVASGIQRPSSVQIPFVPIASSSPAPVASGVVERATPTKQASGAGSATTFRPRGPVPLASGARGRERPGPFVKHSFRPITVVVGTVAARERAGIANSTSGTTTSRPRGPAPVASGTRERATPGHSERRTLRPRTSVRYNLTESSAASSDESSSDEGSFDESSSDEADHASSESSSDEAVEVSSDEVDGSPLNDSPESPSDDPDYIDDFIPSNPQGNTNKRKLTAPAIAFKRHKPWWAASFLPIDPEQLIKACSFEDSHYAGGQRFKCVLCVLGRDTPGTSLHQRKPVPLSIMHQMESDKHEEWPLYVKVRIICGLLAHEPHFFMFFSEAMAQTCTRVAYSDLEPDIARLVKVMVAEGKIPRLFMTVFGEGQQWVRVARRVGLYGKTNTTTKSLRVPWVARVANGLLPVEYTMSDQQTLDILYGRHHHRPL